MRDPGGGPSESRNQAATNGRGQDAANGRRRGLGAGAGGRQADAAALAAAAASLNTFKGDGSFMDSFQQKAGKLRAQCLVAMHGCSQPEYAEHTCKRSLMCCMSNMCDHACVVA